MTSFTNVPKYIEHSKLGETLALDEYQQLAMRTAKQLDRQGALEHAALGMCSDAGELLSVIKAWKVYGKPLDVANACEECGDVLWFITYAATTLGERLSTIATLYGVVPYRDLSRTIVHRSLRLVNHCAYASVHLAFPEYFKHLSAMEYLAMALEYLELIMDELGLTFQQVAQANVAKLCARYPDKYSDAAAIARRDKESELSTGGQAE